MTLIFWFYWFGLVDPWDQYYRDCWWLCPVISFIVFSSFWSYFYSTCTSSKAHNYWPASRWGRKLLKSFQLSTFCSGSENNLWLPTPKGIICNRFFLKLFLCSPILPSFYILTSESRVSLLSLKNSKGFPRNLIAQRQLSRSPAAQGLYKQYIWLKW